MSANSWSHRLVRPLARVLIGTRVSPNHLTRLRIITGGIACVCFAWGTRGTQITAGVVWIISALLDRADGELARLSGRTSPAGHLSDTRADTGVNVALFVAVGVGMRHGTLGYWAIALGMLCGISMYLCARWSDDIEDELQPGAVVMGGAGGFDPDDLFYLIGPFAWGGVLDHMLAAGAVVLPLITTAIGIWRWHAARRARQVVSGAASGTDHQTRNV